MQSYRKERERRALEHIVSQRKSSCDSGSDLLRLPGHTHTHTHKKDEKKSDKVRIKASH
jgi:hypothetical protein